MSKLNNDSIGEHVYTNLNQLKLASQLPKDQTSYLYRCINSLLVSLIQQRLNSNPKIKQIDFQIPEFKFENEITEKLYQEISQEIIEMCSRQDFTKQLEDL